MGSTIFNIYSRSKVCFIFFSSVIKCLDFLRSDSTLKVKYQMRSDKGRVWAGIVTKLLYGTPFLPHINENADILPIKISLKIYRLLKETISKALEILLLHSLCFMTFLSDHETIGWSFIE